MSVDPKLIWEILKRRRKLLQGCIGICTLLAVVYTLVMPRRWSATQALYVRDEGKGNSERLGRFESVDAMQTAQETILQLAGQHAVLEAALRAAGPEKPRSESALKAYPSLKEVDKFRAAVSVEAPKGTQFGRTEMIYLAVKAKSVPRAVALTTAMTSSLIDHAKTLRRQKYAGITKELERTVDQSRKDLAQANEVLRELESKVGPDLGELRAMSIHNGGDGQLRLATTEIEREVRKAEADLLTKRSQRSQLVEIQADSRKLIAMPSEVLDRHPLLKKLKEGLVEAQLVVSRTLGELNESHPRSQAAMDAEQKVRARLLEELRTTISTLDNEIETAQERLAQCQSDYAKARERMQALAGVRGKYDLATAEVKQRAMVLESAEVDLAAARANLVGSDSASLIQRIDEPVPSTKPLGPGMTTIWAGATFGGLILGLGIIFLLEPGFPRRGRRVSDVPTQGRRAEDQKRRQADRPPTIWRGESVG